MPGRDDMPDREEDDRPQGPQGRPVPGAKRAEREARLAEQLRANLQRRKQQARQRAARPEEPGPDGQS